MTRVLATDVRAQRPSGEAVCYAGQMRSEIIDVVPDALERGMGLMEALNKAQTPIQVKLDGKRSGGNGG